MQNSKNMAFAADKRKYTNFKPYHKPYKNSCSGSRSFATATGRDNKGYNGGTRQYEGGASNARGGFRQNNEKRPYYFCTHCQIPGHSNQRCYELHGYPLNFKVFKERKANATFSYSNKIAGTQYEIGSSSEADKGITQSQYYHLISLVEKMQSNDSKQINHDAPHAMLAGKFCFQFRKW